MWNRAVQPCRRKTLKHYTLVKGEWWMIPQQPLSLVQTPFVGLPRRWRISVKVPLKARKPPTRRVEEEHAWKQTFNVWNACGRAVQSTTSQNHLYH